MRYIPPLSCRVHVSGQRLSPDTGQILLFQISPVNAKHRSLPEIIRSLFNPTGTRDELAPREGIASSSIDKEFHRCCSILAETGKPNNQGKPPAESISRRKRAFVSHRSIDLHLRFLAFSVQIFVLRYDTRIRPLNRSPLKRLLFDSFLLPNAFSIRLRQCRRR